MFVIRVRLPQQCSIYKSTARLQQNHHDQDRRRCCRCCLGEESHNYRAPGSISVITTLVDIVYTSVAVERNENREIECHCLGSLSCGWFAFGWHFLTVSPCASYHPPLKCVLIVVADLTATQTTVDIFHLNATAVD